MPGWTGTLRRLRRGRGALLYAIGVIDLDACRAALAAYRPRLLPAEGRYEASVALVLAPAAGEPEVLFIERARREGDPWSGHMALPGGRREATDLNVAAVAERETAEELGLALSASQRLGRIDDLEGRHSGRPAGLVVSCFVYGVERPSRITPNEEVRDVLWVPVSRLLDPGRAIPDYRRLDRGRPYPGIRVSEASDQVVWGMTYRFLAGFFDVIGAPLP